MCHPSGQPIQETRILQCATLALLLRLKCRGITIELTIKRTILAHFSKSWMTETEGSTDTTHMTESLYTTILSQSNLLTNLPRLSAEVLSSSKLTIATRIRWKTI